MRYALLALAAVIVVAALTFGVVAARGGGAAPTATPGILDNYCPTQASGGTPRCVPGAPPLRPTFDPASVPTPTGKP